MYTDKHIYFFPSKADCILIFIMDSESKRIELECVKAAVTLNRLLPSLIVECCRFFEASYLFSPPPPPVSFRWKE